MANRELWVAGLGLGINGQTTWQAQAVAGSLSWCPAMVTTQSAWSSGTSYTGCTALQTGSQVTSNSITWVCVKAGGGTSTVAPPSSQTQGTVYAASDGYYWLALGTTTADMTNLANGSQAVSQIIFDNNPIDSYGDTYAEVSVSIASGSSGAAGDIVTILAQYLNQDGSTYGDGLGGGTNLSTLSSSYAGTVPYPAGKSSPIVGAFQFPIRPGRFRVAVQNGSGNAFSSSTHVIAIRTGALTTNG